MTLRNITNEYFKIILVQVALYQHATGRRSIHPNVGCVPIAQNGTHLPTRKELMGPHQGAVRPTPAGRPEGHRAAGYCTMQHLKPADLELWFRYQYFSRLPANIQRLLAEQKGSVEELAARADELQRKAPPMGAAPTIAPAHVTDNVMAATHKKIKN